MPVTTTLLTSAYNTADQTSYTTASISPSAGVPILLFVSSRQASAVPPTSVSGCSLTWEQTANVGGGSHNISLYHASGTPTTGAITIDYGAATQTGGAWSIVELENSDPGSNGASAIIQSNAVSGSGVSSIGVSLAAFADTNNATIGFFSVQLNEALVNEAGYTVLSNDYGSPPSMGNMLEFYNAPDTSVGASWSANDIYRAIVAEIKFVSSRKRLTLLGVG